LVIIGSTDRVISLIRKAFLAGTGRPGPALLPTLVPLQLLLVDVRGSFTPSWERNAVDVTAVAGS
jgi:hypothetical protein